MPNRRHNPEPKSTPPKAPSGHRPDATPERTAAWAGLPGKTQGKSRDKAGTYKCHGYAKSEGL